MIFGEIIKSISDVCLLTDWKPNARNVYSIFIDGSFELNLSQDRDFVIFRCFFGNFKKKFGHSFFDKYRTILQWNFWHVKNNENVVCFSREKKQVCITRVENMKTLDSNRIKILLDEFLKDVEFWKEVTYRKPYSLDTMKFKPELLIK